MTREWQEASNEYLKVRHHRYILPVAQLKLTRNHRAKEPTPSPVSRPRATRARARSSRLPRVLNRSGGFPLSIEKLDAHHGRHRSMYKTGTRWEDAGGLSRWGWGADQREAGLVYIMYNDDNATTFFFESHTEKLSNLETIRVLRPRFVPDTFGTSCSICSS